MCIRDRINDGSTQEEYYKYSLPKNVQQINLKQNQKEINGFSSDAIRNFGIEVAESKYVAFLDEVILLPPIILTFPTSSVVKSVPLLTNILSASKLIEFPKWNLLFFGR